MKYFLSYFTKENITFVLAVIGSLGTLFSLISSFMTKRKNLKITISKSAYRTDLHRLAIVLTFENRSWLPITVTSIKVFYEGNELPLETYPLCVSEYSHRHGNEVVDRKFQYNLNLPVGISQLDAVSGYIVLGISPKEFENVSTPLILQVRSTRGRVQKIELNPNSIKCF